MKFTHTQKKWAMTSALLLALGFNFTYNKHSYGISSVDLASTDEVAEGKLTTSAGVATVKYVKVSDKKVLAIRPQIVEGKFCDTCENKTTEIEGSFGKEVSDIDKLNVALLKKMEEEGRVKPAPKPADERSEVVNSRRITPEKNSKEKKESWASTALKNCEGKNSRTETSAEVDCRLTEITTALADERISEKEITEFYVRYAAKDLALSLGSTDESIVQDAKDQLKLLEEELLNYKGFKELRAKMAQTLAAGVGAYANEVRSKQIAFSQAKDVWSQQSAMNDYQNATRNLYSRINDFADRENSFLAASVGSRSIAQTDVGYIFSAYQSPVSQIITQVNTPLSPNQQQQIQVGQVPGTAIPGTIGIQNGQPIVLDPRLQNGRGVGVASNTTYAPQVTIPQAGQLPTQIPVMTSPTGVQYMMVPAQGQTVYNAGSTMWPTTTPISTLNTTTISPLSTTNNGANLNGRISSGRF